MSRVGVNPAPGWVPFGTHADERYRFVKLEFSDEKGEDGFPLWERAKPKVITVYLPGDKAPAGCAECGELRFHRMGCSRRPDAAVGTPRIPASLMYDLLFSEDEPLPQE